MGTGPQAQQGAQPPLSPRSLGHTLPGLLPANDHAPPQGKQSPTASQSLQRRWQSRQASETGQGALLCLLLARGCVHPQGNPPQTRKHTGSSSPPSSPLLRPSRLSRAPEPDPEARPSVQKAQALDAKPSSWSRGGVSAQACLCLIQALDCSLCPRRLLCGGQS